MGTRQSCLILVVLLLSDLVIPGRKNLQDLQSSDWKFIMHCVKEVIAQTKGRTKEEDKGLFS